MSRNEATPDERREITGLLADIEDDRDVMVLAARDYGSRARNLESEDSDYDVFFVFLQDEIDYIIGPTYTDVIERSYGPEGTDLDTEVELHGWNLRKFIGGSDLKGHADGLIGSNPMAMEFVASDTEYYYGGDPPSDIVPYLADLDEHMANNFKPYALMRHYHSLALGNYQKYIKGDWTINSYDELLDHAMFHDVNDDVPMEVDEEYTEVVNDEFINLTAVAPYKFHDQLDLDEMVDAGIVERTTQDVTVKRYLAICQALVRRKYIEQTHDLPPMDFTELLRIMANDLSQQAYDEFGHLISMKKRGHGGGKPGEPRLEFLDEWIESELDRDIEPEGHVERTPDVSTVVDLTGKIIDVV